MSRSAAIATAITALRHTGPIYLHSGSDGGHDPLSMPCPGDAIGNQEVLILRTGQGAGVADPGGGDRHCQVMDEGAVGVSPGRHLRDPLPETVDHMCRVCHLVQEAMIWVIGARGLRPKVDDLDAVGSLGIEVGAQLAQHLVRVLVGSTVLQPGS